MKKNNAVTIGCQHRCPQSDGNKPHFGGLVVKGAKSVFVNNKPVCREGDLVLCMSPKKNKIKKGSKKVFIENKAAARIGDPTNHKGKISTGESNVFFG